MMGKNMAMRHLFIMMGMLMLSLGSGVADDVFIQGKPEGRILAAGDRRVMVMEPSGKIVWEYPTKLTHDAWMLPNGNVLFADGETVTEVTPAKTVVFQYKPAEQKGGGVFACQRLDHGRTLIGENSTGRILEVDSDGKIQFTLQTTPSELGHHHNMRMARKLASGHYLVCHSGTRWVKEYTPEGKVVWEVAVQGPLAFSAIRTPKGTTLVCSLDQIVEYDAQAKPVWECKRQEVAGASIQNMTGMHLQPDGHILVGCYQAYQNGGNSGLFEITRDKKLVWRYTNPSADGTMMSVELLSPQGARLEGPCLR